MKPTKLELICDSSTKDFTLGHIDIDGQRQCYTVEDEYRATKVIRFVARCGLAIEPSTQPYTTLYGFSS